MRTLLALFCLTFLFACSNDDDVKETQKKYLTQMNFTNDGVTTTIHFEYDDSKNITAIKAGGDGDDDLYYTYNGTKLSTIRAGNETEPSMTFTYTADKLTGYTTNYDGDNPVSYNEQTKKYIFGDDDYKYEVSLKGRDVATISPIGGEANFYMNFEQNRKGPLYNVATDNVFLLNLFSTYSPLLFVNAPTDFLYSGVLFTCENIYNNDNYLIKMMLTSNENTAITIDYIYE